MDWWFAIAAVVAAALAYGYWSHTRHSRELAAVLSLLAIKYDAALKSASVLALPQLRFERNGRRFLVTAMATSGSDGPDSGPFSLAILDLPFDTGVKVRLSRRAGKSPGLTGAAAVGDPAAVHDAFDAAFKVRGPDSDAIDRLLDTSAQLELLKSPLPRLKLRVDGAKIDVHMDGYATSAAEIEGLIGLADLLADRFAPKD